MGDADNIPDNEFAWNLLPPEMKAHCVKQMNFKTRAGLRCSSKTDMQIVDSVKFSLSKVAITYGGEGEGFVVSIEENNEILTVEFRETENESSEDASIEDEEVEELSAENPKEFEKVTSFLKQVLKADIDDLRLGIEFHPYAEQDAKLLTEIMTQGPILNVKELIISLNHDKSIGIETLKRCSPNVLTQIGVLGFHAMSVESIEEFLRLPQVLNAQKLHVHPCYFATSEDSENMFKACLESWTQNGVSKEKVLQIGFEPGMHRKIDEFVESLNLSMIRRHEHGNVILVKTDDPSKQVWIRSAMDNSFMQLYVLGTDSKEPDFETMNFEEFLVLMFMNCHASDSEADYEDSEDDEFPF